MILTGRERNRLQQSSVGIVGGVNVMFPVFLCYFMSMYAVNGFQTSFTTGSIYRRNDVSQQSSRFEDFVGIRLFSSKSDTNDDDELSKLIGKRNQIKRKKKTDISEIVEELQTPNEPVVDLDLDKLPEFKTKRPMRSSKKKEDDDDNNEKDGKNDKSSSDAPIVDFMAEYQDENDFHIPNRIGVSTICWGDTSRNFVPGSNQKLSKRMIKAGKFVAGDVQLAYQSLLAGGITFIETSPVYGAASSRSSKMAAEELLGLCMKEHPDDLPDCMIQTSTGVSSWKSLILQGKGSVTKAFVSSLEQSLIRLSGGRGEDLPSIDLFTAPKSMLFPTTLLAAGLAAQIESGQANYVGVQGVTKASKLRKLCQKLEARECSLTTNSFDFSLTNTKNEQMIDVCKELNVVPLITNPLDNGLASGVYTATNPSGGGSSGAAKFTFKQLEKLQPLHSVQETIAERVRVRVSRGMRDTQERFKSKYGPPPKINTDITTTQVALQWIIAKGGVPLPTVNSPKEAEEVLGCLGWTLTDEEVEMIDAAVALCKL